MPTRIAGFVQHMLLTTSRLIGVSLLTTALLHAPLTAQTNDLDLTLHGYGGLAYGRTDGNTFDLGSHIGNYENFNFALAMSASLSDRLRIAVQGSVTHENEADVFDVNYAQAEWHINDAFVVRVGRVRQPFGLYTEIFQVGTLRPFFSLPQSLYGPSGFVSESFTGLEVAGGNRVRGPWQLDYTLYGGHIELPTSTPLQLFTDSSVEHFSPIIGGRLNLQGPAGLLVGVSGFTGHAELKPDDRDVVVGCHLAYVGSIVLLRAEAADHHAPDERAKVAYAEAGYHVTDHWQVVTRVDQLHGSFQTPSLAQIPDGDSYRERAAGLNYWVTPETVLKTSLHYTTGRRFATTEPDTNGDIPAGVLPKGHTTLYAIGAQISF